MLIFCLCKKYYSACYENMKDYIKNNVNDECKKIIAELESKQSNDIDKKLIEMLNDSESVSTVDPNENNGNFKK